MADHPHHHKEHNHQQHHTGVQARGGDRRGGDRRALDRRAPPPVWRRPWAYVTYGVVAALALVLAVRGMGGGAETPKGPLPDSLSARATPPREVVQPKAQDGPTEEAYGAEDFERLVLEGTEAQGKRVRAELFCDAPGAVALQEVEQMEAAVAALVDRRTNRVPAAACKWGRRDDARREDLLLLVPPEFADAFSSTPLTNDDFVRRRHLVADVEWVGKSAALALRTAAVLRGISPPR